MHSRALLNHAKIPQAAQNISAEWRSFWKAIREYLANSRQQYPWSAENVEPQRNLRSKHCLGSGAGTKLEPEEIKILINYVIALHEFGPMTAKIVRSYGERSLSTEGLVNFDNGVRLEPLSPTNGHR